MHIAKDNPPLTSMKPHQSLWTTLMFAPREPAFGHPPHRQHSASTPGTRLQSPARSGNNKQRNSIPSHCLQPLRSRGHSREGRECLRVDRALSPLFQSWKSLARVRRGREDTQLHCIKIVLNWPYPGLELLIIKEAGSYGINLRRHRGMEKENSAEHGWRQWLQKNKTILFLFPS